MANKLPKPVRPRTLLFSDNEYAGSAMFLNNTIGRKPSKRRAHQTRWKACRQEGASGASIAIPADLLRGTLGAEVPTTEDAGTSEEVNLIYLNKTLTESLRGLIFAFSPAGIDTMAQSHGAQNAGQIQPHVNQNHTNIY